MLGGISGMKDIGAALTLSAHSAGDKDGAAETVLTGGDFDRLPAGGGDASAQQFESMVAVISAHGSLTAAATLSLSLVIQHADLNAAGTGPGAYANAPAASQPTAAAVINGGAGGAYNSALRYDLRLTELKRFIRINTTPDFSINNVSETAKLAVVIVAGGAHNVVTRSVDYTPTYDA